MINRIYISLCVLLMSISAIAQVDSLNNAYSYYSKGDYNKAKVAIDAAAKNEATSAMKETWYIRSFIYKELYKRNESDNPKSSFRNEAVIATIKAIELDKDNQYPELKPSLKFIARTYYNDAGQYFTADGYKTAAEYFNLFEKYMLIVDDKYKSTKEYRDIKVNFFQSLASAMNTIFESNRDKFKYMFKEIEDTYKIVIAVDTNDSFSFYNLSMLYYNQGVYVINSMDPDNDFFRIDQIQDDAREYFRKCLPYALKAYRLNPNRKEILQALENIYHALYDEENAAIYKEKLKVLEGK